MLRPTPPALPTLRWAKVRASLRLLLALAAIAAGQSTAVRAEPALARGAAVQLLVQRAEADAPREVTVDRPTAAAIRSEAAVESATKSAGPSTARLYLLHCALLC